MRDRIRIFVLATVLTLGVVVAPAQARPDADRGDSPAVGWWATVVDALTTLFGLDGADGSCMIDPWGCPDNPEPPPTPQGDGSCMIDPQGGCHS